MKITIEEETAFIDRKVALVQGLRAPVVASGSAIPNIMVDMYVSVLYPGSPNPPICKDVSKIKAFLANYDRMYAVDPNSTPALVDLIALWMRNGNSRALSESSKAVTAYMERLDKISRALPSSGSLSVSQSKFSADAAENINQLLRAVNGAVCYPQVLFLRSLKNMFKPVYIREMLANADPLIPDLIDAANKLIDQELRTHQLMGPTMINSRVTGESRDI